MPNWRIAYKRKRYDKATIVTITVVKGHKQCFFFSIPDQRQAQTCETGDRSSIVGNVDVTKTLTYFLRLKALCYYSRITQFPLSANIRLTAHKIEN